MTGDAGAAAAKSAAAQTAGGPAAAGARPARFTSSLFINVSNLLAGAALVWSGAADRLWRAIEPETPWRNGPAWQATFAYFCLCAAGWAVLNVALFAIAHRAVSLEQIVLRAGRFVVAACAVTIIQVLMPAAWPLLACAAALPPALLSGGRQRGRWRWLAWAWLATGVGLASLLIDRYFVGTPTFVPRLALCLTAWRLLAARWPLLIGGRGAWIPDWLP